MVGDYTYADDYGGKHQSVCDGYFEMMSWFGGMRSLCDDGTCGRRDGKVSLAPITVPSSPPLPPLVCC